MKNIKFAAFFLALAAAIGMAMAGLAAQEPMTSLMLLGPGSHLGVTVRDVESAKAGDTAPGVRIDDVAGGSAAERAGLKAGDVVVEFDGERVRSARQFTRLVQETPEGRTVTVAVLRDGQRQTLEATPERRMAGMRGLRMVPPMDFEFRAEPGEPRRFEFWSEPEFRSRSLRSSRARLGVTVTTLTPQLAEFFGVKGDGVIVSSVTPGSAAEKAGLKAGDVITAIGDARVRDAADLAARIEDARDRDVSIGIVRDKKETTLKALLAPE